MANLPDGGVLANRVGRTVRRDGVHLDRVRGVAHTVLKDGFRAKMDVLVTGGMIVTARLYG